jgi:GH15 family glucan-1,4-alpha-glucosidase
MAETTDSPPIEDYFIIGDLRTAALVSSRGSIDWLCLPYFDSPSVFGKLLDSSAGCLSIEMPGYKISSKYAGETAIVEFELSNGKDNLTIRDFMVPQPTKSEVSQYLVRSISGKRGKAVFKFNPKPEFGLRQPDIKIGKGRLRLALDDGFIVLHLPGDSEVAKKQDYYQIEVPVEGDQNKYLILEYIPKGRQVTKDSSSLETKTQKFWRQWVKQGDFIDFCRGSLIRSAITLKLMQFYPTGALVAAPTTSLPEEIGGVRNWDYRYSWIRDATFALYAFYILGYHREAEHFFNFIEKVTEQCAEPDFDVSLMYTIWGEPVPKERPLKQLSGYKNSKPVRVGNNASRQFQLDVYGSLIDAFYFATKHKLVDVNRDKWRELIMRLVHKIDQLWQKPDHGIWEARIGTRHYTYSKVMAWVGADRAKRLAKPLDLMPEDLEVCDRLAGSIEKYIWENSYKDGSLVQHQKTKAADATNFLFVLLQFLDKHQPRTKKIISSTRQELSHKGVFVYRYLKPDGLPGEEGAFLLCSYWLISALAILEDVEPAIDLFKRLEKHINPQGLLAEEISPATKEYLGNYPQTFSHMGYIMSANYIDKYAKRKNIKL